MYVYILPFFQKNELRSGLCDPLKSSSAQVLPVDAAFPELPPETPGEPAPEDPETAPQPDPEQPTPKQTDGGGKSDGKGDPSAGVDGNKHVIFKVAGMILLGWFCLHRW